jgi:hypothetical protein
MNRRTILYSLILGAVCVVTVLLSTPSISTRGAPPFQGNPTASPTTQNLDRITTANANRVVHVRTMFPPIFCECLRPNALAWSPDGNMLAVARSVGVFLYDVNALDVFPRLLKRDLGSIPLR